MAPLNKEVEIRPSNVLPLAEALRTASFHREKIKASKNRCTAEISSWTSEVLKQVEEVREELMEEVEQVHAEAEENVTKEEIEIRKQGWTTFKADFKPFNLAISPRLEALLLSGERLASLTDSPLFPSHLSLQLVTFSSQLLPTVTCSVVATKGLNIKKGVRSSLQLKVTTESGVDIICREEMVGESCLLFTFSVAPTGEEKYKVEAMLASLHLPGSPLIIPPFSRVETIASELGLLLKDNNDEIDKKEFKKVSSPELTEITSYQETRVMTEEDIYLEVDKLSSSKEVAKEKCQGQLQEEKVLSTEEPMVKVEKGMESEVNKSSHSKHARKEVVKEKCQLGQGQGVQAVTQLRRPAGKSNNLTGNMNTESQCASLAEQQNVVQVDPIPIKAADQAPAIHVVADHLGTRIEETDKKLEVGDPCYLLEEDTKMWHAGRVHNVLNGLVVVKNLDNQKFTGCHRGQVVLRIEDIPQGAMCADSAKKTGMGKGIKVNPGEKCVARWREDLVWYNAEILATTSNSITVRFVDYGNEVDVGDCDIVSAGWEVPAEDLRAGQVDCNVVLKKEVSETRLDNETSWYRGETCLARWEEDGVWYRAEVVKATSEGSTRVLFVDYGNQDDATDLVRTAAELSEDDVKDLHVEAVGDLPNQQTSKGDSAKPADAVLEESGETELKEVDISELSCCVCGKLKKAMHRVQCDRAPVCWNCAVKKITSNKHTCWRCSTSSVSSISHLVKDPVLDLCARDYLTGGKLNLADMEALRQSRMGTVGLNLCSLVTNGVIVAHKQMVISARQPVGLAVAEDEIMVVSQGDVLRFSKQGEARGRLYSPRPLKNPSDILHLSSGRLAVAHEEGVAFFSQECEFLRNLDKVGGSCYGLAEDGEGHLLTISVNMGSEKAGRTEPGMTDVIYIDTSKDKVVKRIELVDVIQEEERKETKCRSIAYHNGKIFVGDIGRNRIFVLDDTADVETVGETGNGRLQFKGPTCLVADSEGSILVVDSHNHRIQLINPDYTFAAMVKVDYPLARPTSIFLDGSNRQLWVANFLSNNVVLSGLF